MGNVFEWLQEWFIFCLTNNLSGLWKQGPVPPRKCWEPCTQTHKLMENNQNIFFPLKHKHCATDPAPQGADNRARLTSHVNAETEQLQYPDTTVGVSLEMLFQWT